MSAWKTALQKIKNGKYGKYLLLALLFGAALLLLTSPTTAGQTGTQTTETAISPPAFDLREQEERLASAIGSIAGAGRAQVMLSVYGGVARELAQENGEALILSSGGGAQSPVELRYTYPEYLGALVICEGGNDPRVCLAVTKAVQAVTGLGSDKITVSPLA